MLVCCHLEIVKPPRNLHNLSLTLELDLVHVSCVNEGRKLTNLTTLVSLGYLDEDKKKLDLHV